MNSEKVKEYWEKIKEALKKVPKKIWILIAAVLVIIILIAAVYILSRPYVELVTGTNSEEMSTIMTWLEEQGVTDYRLEGGDTILVPKGQEATLKARLLMEGYPKSGYSFGTYTDSVGILSTESEREQAWLITIMERMGAIIRNLEGVKDAAVTITPGEDNGYVLDSGNIVDASASVMVTMRDGGMLTQQQAEAIRRLVAGGVQGLEVDYVEIIDSLGNTYSSFNASGISSDASDLKLQLEEKYSNQTRTRIMQVLIPLYGEENVKVSVTSSVDVDNTIQEIKDVSLPPWADDGSTEGAGIIGSVIYDHYLVRGGEEAVGGLVGTTTNADLPEYVEIEIVPDGSETEIGTSGQIDYNNDETMTYVERTAGRLVDCTVAVTINSSTAGAVNAGDLRAHVARAAGINAVVTEEMTADEYLASKISIYSGPFYVEEVPPFDPDEFPVPMWAVYAAAGGLLLFLILLIILLRIRRKRKKRQEEERQRQEMEALLAAAGLAAEQDGGADVMSMQSERTMELRKDIRQFVDENPEIAAQMIKSWLRGGDDDG